MKDNNEVLTKGFFLDFMEKFDLRIDAKIDRGVGELAHVIAVSSEVVESRLSKQEALMNSLLKRVEGIEKDINGFHGNFDIIFGELRAIRNQLKEVDSRVEVLDLQLRMDKVERKIKLSKAS